MKCFVIAMQKEAQPLIDMTIGAYERVICGKRVICGSLFGEEVGIVICGVGKVNAAGGTQIALDLLKADVIVNIGYAGGLNGQVKVGGIYGISEAVQYDFDLVQLNGTEIGTLNECDENYLPLAVTPLYPLKKLGTGDRFNDSFKDYELLTKTLGADVRDMEGGAIAQICTFANVRCYSFKIISDVAGNGSTTEQFNENLLLCAETLSRELKNICEAVTEDCNG